MIRLACRRWMGKDDFKKTGYYKQERNLRLPQLIILILSQVAFQCVRLPIKTGSGHNCPQM